MNIIPKTKKVIIDNETKVIIVSPDYLTPDEAFDMRHEDCHHCPWCEGVICNPEDMGFCFGSGCDDGSDLEEVQNR